MIDIPVPVGNLEDVDLVPERVLQGGRRERLSRRVSVSRPIIVPLTVEQVAADGELAEFVRREATDYVYSLLHLVCTFRPDPERQRSPFVAAELGVLLAGNERPDPLAWSLSPTTRTVRVKRGVKVSLGAKLAFVEPKVEYSSEREGEEPYLRAYGEKQSDPEWRLRRTAGQEIEGDESFSIVVRAPVGVPGTAKIVLAATIRDHALGIIPYRAALEPSVQNVVLSI